MNLEEINPIIALQSTDDIDLRRELLAKVLKNDSHNLLHKINIKYGNSNYEYFPLEWKNKYVEMSLNLFQYLFIEYLEYENCNQYSDLRFILENVDDEVECLLLTSPIKVKIMNKNFEELFEEISLLTFIDSITLHTVDDFLNSNYDNDIYNKIFICQCITEWSDMDKTRRIEYINFLTECLNHIAEFLDHDDELFDTANKWYWSLYHQKHKLLEKQSNLDFDNLPEIILTGSYNFKENDFTEPGKNLDTINPFYFLYFDEFSNEHKWIKDKFQKK